ncbi:ArsR family transcriptional regulator [Natronorubrum sp. JWXQ-INN-674]|uniref:ArsR family transcriptional regulator n=1 Tax=Natronorubrum halalkaliphilum TaxID=2691917 RepID=A0A6B0VQ30_9EURY|nr:ArsR family transcriptional regulator [Natronorubrum halalkaliphilum]MXV63126.1 ArsR family transcriptional regulator [Natronorubrum halalkaliphilum]
MLPVISDPESLTSVSAGSAAETETDAAFDLLADRRRRAVLRFLDENEDPVSLSDLADHLTLEEDGRENGTLASCGDALLGTRRRIHISLRHTHVPKLAGADAVEFDPGSNTVALRETGESLLHRIEMESE